MSTASFKLKGQRLVGKWISIEYEEEGKPVWYKARVDTYGGAQKYEVTWEAGGSEWLEELVDAEYEMSVPPAATRAPGRRGGESTRQRTAGGLAVIVMLFRLAQSDLG